MPFATIDGLATRYDLVGSGEPLLMFSPAGFDATLEKWTTQSVYARSRMLEALASRYQCIIFDRRETGQSGGRVERVTWLDYARQGFGLLQHLGHRRAHVLGGCMGVCPVLALAVAHPAVVRSMILYWPVGGAKYRLASHQRFAEHLAFVQQHGLPAVVDLARREGKAFGADPRGGPWASVLRHDAAFAEAYAALPVDRYKLVVAGMGRTLFDRDTAPGAEPEDLLRIDIPALVVPGADASHAPSAARYLQECLPQADYWDTPVDHQTADTVPPRLLDFLLHS